MLKWVIFVSLIFVNTVYSESGDLIVKLGHKKTIALADLISEELLEARSSNEEVFTVGYTNNFQSLILFPKRAGKASLIVESEDKIDTLDIAVESTPIVLHRKLELFEGEVYLARKNLYGDDHLLDKYKIDKVGVLDVSDFEATKYSFFARSSGAANLLLFNSQDKSSVRYQIKVLPAQDSTEAVIFEYWTKNRPEIVDSIRGQHCDQMQQDLIVLTLKGNTAGSDKFNIGTEFNKVYGYKREDKKFEKFLDDRNLDKQQVKERLILLNTGFTTNLWNRLLSCRSWSLDD